LNLFLHCFNKGHPALQAIVLQIIADILITHPTLLADPAVDTTSTTEKPESNPVLKQVLKAFGKALRSKDHGVQATGAAALAKLMLGRIITEDNILTQLVVAYFDPDYSSNAQFKQSLSYFLPVYCHSRAENASRVAKATPVILAKVAQIRENHDGLDSEDDAAGGMVKLTTVGQMLLDWTDPRKIVGFAETTGSTTAAAGAGETHFLMVEELLNYMDDHKTGRDEKRKLFFSMMGKAHLPDGGCSPDVLQRVLTSVVHAFDIEIWPDETSHKALKKLYDQLLKQVSAVAAAERGGGAEETVLETTELPVETTTVAGAEVEETEGDIMHSFQEGEEEEEEVTQVQKTLRDTTLGATTFGATLTIGVPDAEGTRVQLGGDEDSEMMDVDDYTTTEV
jgi:condensin complex subunit 3